jgi:hypothetical protein
MVARLALFSILFKGCGQLLMVLNQGQKICMVTNIPVHLAVICGVLSSVELVILETCLRNLS